MPLGEELVRALKQTIEVRQMHGAQSPTSLEWWYFTGHLWRNPQRSECDSVHLDKIPPDFAIQSTFFLSDANSQKGIVAHSAEADLTNKKHSHTELVSALGGSGGLSPLAFSEKNFLNMALGHWRLTQLGATQNQLNWDLRFDVKGSEYLLQLSVPKNRFWFHGKDGYLQKTQTSGNFYYSIPFVKVQGLRIGRTQAGLTASESVCGRLWFDHEIHVEKVLDVGWNWFGLSFNNQKALMFYEILSSDKKTPAQGELWDQQKGISAALKNVKIVAGEKVCLRTGRCYPQSFSISFNNPLSGRNEIVKTQSSFAEQELDGGTGSLARIYWEGSTKAAWVASEKDSKNSVQTTEGLGFTELVPQVPKK